MVGGAPVTRRWAEEIGADGYAKDAMSAVELARQLMEQKTPAAVVESA
jgi:methanogenic corrinoid protein MtbC1